MPEGKAKEAEIKPVEPDQGNACAGSKTSSGPLFQVLEFARALKPGCRTKDSQPAFPANFLK